MSRGLGDVYKRQLYVAGKADSMADGVKLAEKVIDTGLAKAQLERFIKLSNA